MQNRPGRLIALLTVLVSLVGLSVASWSFWPHIRFRWLFEHLGANEQGYPEYRHRQTGIVFVRLPGGRFWMGSGPEEIDLSVARMKEFLKKPPLPSRHLVREMNGPEELRRRREFLESTEVRHEVLLDPFLIGKCELSQAEWKRVMGGLPEEVWQGDDRPIHKITFEDCQEFCARSGLLLPTEAQWEYACRAGTETPYAFGSSLTEAEANFQSNATVSVLSFKPNGFGLHNMHGNVSEFCADFYNRQFYVTPEASLPNPVCRTVDRVYIDVDKLRVVRGGDCFNGAVSCRSGRRSEKGEKTACLNTGFRPAYYPLP